MLFSCFRVCKSKDVYISVIKLLSGTSILLPSQVLGDFTFGLSPTPNFQLSSFTAVICFSDNTVLSHPSVCLLPSSFTYGGHYENIGLIHIIQGNLPILKSLNKSESSLACKVMQLWVMRNGRWASLEVTDLPPAPYY